MSDEAQPWATWPFLDVLRPAPDQRVTHAILATYSADLVAVVASLLALAGLDDDRGTGSRVDFVNAYDELNGRVKVLAQAGHLRGPAECPEVLGLMDRFVEEIRFDEAYGSWHPKVALICLEGRDDGREEWRLWVGSRNLTRDLSWDAALTLVGSFDAGVRIPGVEALMVQLATRARLDGLGAREARQRAKRLRWRTPDGVRVEQIMVLGEGRGRLPDPPAGLTSLTVISPFLSSGALEELGGWGSGPKARTLVSTTSAILSVSKKARASFGNLAALDPPDEEEEPESDDDEQLANRGLHAKIIHARTKSGDRIWLGSANASRRAWSGKNTEVVAALHVSTEVADALLEFAKQARPVDEAGWEDWSDSKVTDPEHLLDEGQKHIAAAFSGKLSVLRGEIRLSLERALPVPVGMQLEVSLLGCERSVYVRRRKSVQLPTVPLGQLSELVVLRLRLDGRVRQWVHRAAMSPQPTEERDRAAIARYLDPRTYLAWLRSTLGLGYRDDGGGDWDSRRNSSSGARDAGPEVWAPTLEDVLKAYVRDPDSLAILDLRIERYLDRMLENTEAYGERERRVLEDLATAWPAMKQVLLGGT